MSDGLFALKCFHNSGIYQEFTVCKYSLMNSFRFLFTFLLLDLVDSDALHWRSKLDIYAKDVIFCDCFLDRFLSSRDFAFWCCRLFFVSSRWSWLSLSLFLFFTFFFNFFFLLWCGGKEYFMLHASKWYELDIQLFVCKTSLVLQINIGIALLVIKC